ncbi:CAZyme family GH71 [Trichoderma aggressivum f. europaeum]|uniref:CAZyme family GH71 n=1 Tax=Trichoderma aggressivum f. europaeum TaxID=173218 RepID=A0AAE1M0I2_9HYPO|nr:CAZyme family GH71 [Trichoderma aggressivum f. europaeum]
MKLSDTLGILAALLVPYRVQAAAVFAHFMVGNVPTWGVNDWESNMRLAQASHIDAFALNVAFGWPQNDASVAQAFQAAEAVGFRLFFSFDYAGNGSWPMNVVTRMLNQYGGSNAHFKYQGKPFTSTFEGPANADDWNTIKANTGCFFVPNYSSLGVGGGVADGLFSWAAWPYGPNNMTTNTIAIPQLALGVHASPRLSLTLPYDLEFTLRRIDDNTSRPCIVRWSPGVEAFSAAGLELWRHTSRANDGSDSLVRVEVDYSGGAKLAVASPRLLVQGWDPFLWELWPGGHVRFTAPLHERYHKGLVEGERYDLVWPGGEIAMWDWGTKHEHVGLELRVDASQPPLRVPARCRVSFTAAAEAENGAKRLEAIAEQERAPSTPLLSATLECPSTIPYGHPFGVTLKVTHGGLVSDTHELELTGRSVSAKASVCGVNDGERHRMTRMMTTNGMNATFRTTMLFLIADDPPVVVRIRNDVDNFVTLRVGETWNLAKVFDWSSLPDDTMPGDVFSFVFQGTSVDWWDWGSQEQSIETQS